MSWVSVRHQPSIATLTCKACDTQCTFETSDDEPEYLTRAAPAGWTIVVYASAWRSNGTPGPESKALKQFALCPEHSRAVWKERDTR